MSYFFMFILAQANTTSLQQIRPLDLFCYYAICAMALKFEIACGDDAQYDTESLCALSPNTLPDAKWWRPFSKEPDAKWWRPWSKEGGENAFKEKPVLFTSAFNPNGSGTMYAYKYNFSHSINLMTTSYRLASQEVKVYEHCGGLHKIFVRRAPSLRVSLLTSLTSLQPSNLGASRAVVCCAGEAQERTRPHSHNHLSQNGVKFNR